MINSYTNWGVVCVRSSLQRRVGRAVRVGAQPRDQLDLCRDGRGVSAAPPVLFMCLFMQEVL